MTIDFNLREVCEEDLHIFYTHQIDPDATRVAAFPSRDWDTFAVHWKKILQDEEVFVRTILFNGRVAGNIVSYKQDGKREVGYWIGKEFWGWGIATRALSEFMGHV